MQTEAHALLQILRIGLRHFSFPQSPSFPKQTSFYGHYSTTSTAYKPKTYLWQRRTYANTIRKSSRYAAALQILPRAISLCRQACGRIKPTTTSQLMLWSDCRLIFFDHFERHRDLSIQYPHYVFEHAGLHYNL